MRAEAGIEPSRLIPELLTRLHYHSFIEQTFREHVQCTVLGAEDTVLNKTDPFSALMALTCILGRT